MSVKRCEGVADPARACQAGPPDGALERTTRTARRQDLTAALPGAVIADRRVSESGRARVFIMLVGTAMSQLQPLAWGTPGPYFEAPTVYREKFHFSSLGGRFVVLLFLQNAGVPIARTALMKLRDADIPRDDDRFVVFGVTTEAADAKNELLESALIDERYFLDTDEKVSRLYQALPPDGSKGAYHHHWVVLDPTMRVYASGPLTAIDVLVSLMRGLPRADEHGGITSDWAPVLFVPRVLEPDFCKSLIDVYTGGAPEASGTMQEKDGLTVRVQDRSFKRRADVEIKDQALRNGLNRAVANRIVPEIRKAFQFEASRIERYIVACYSGEDKGFFRPHRDNTTKGTAHRRFAVTINLNAEDYDGGELRFPEFGDRVYKAPTGGAIVFSCSLLHEARPVTRGMRYATLPFLYDNAAEKIRRENLHYLQKDKAAG